MKKVLVVLVIMLLAATMVGACKGSQNASTSGQASVTPVQAEASQAAAPEKTASETPATDASGKPSVETDKSGVLTFVIKTDKGEMKGEFYPQDAPNTVVNFVTLAKKGFYNGLTFHRVEPGFVIQGGDPKGNGTGGPGYQIPAEFNKKPHALGAIAMARTADPNSAGSQFYIVLNEENCRQLDGNYTVFGRVTEGFDNALKIQKGDKIKSIEITGELPKDLKGKEVKKSGTSAE